MSDTPPKNNPGSDKAAERRTCHRQAVSCRSAIWFDEGPKEGMLGTIVDISTGGFSVTLQTAPPSAFSRKAPVYCVLLLQNAHIGCMATPISVIRRENEAIQIGFRFEALSRHDSRLLSGVLQFLANAKNDADAPLCSRNPEVICNPSRCTELGLEAGG